MSDIEWTDVTWNPAVGCSRVSAGCMNCYAERVAHRGMAAQHKGLTRLSSKGPQWTGEVRFVADKLGDPLKWKKPRRVFVNSMSDLFHEGLTNVQIAAVFGVMAACPQQTFQVLTKRPARMREWFAWIEAQSAVLAEIAGRERTRYAASLVVDHAEGLTDREIPEDDDDAPRPWPLPNVWLGVSAENQATADVRIPLLLDTPAAVRFVSAEPLLGPIDILSALRDEPSVGITGKLDWVIVGGESGPGARPCALEWIGSIVEQCRVAGAACFVKQLGARPHDRLSSASGTGWDAEAMGRWPEGARFYQRVPGNKTHEVVLKNRKGNDPAEWPEDLRVRQFPEVTRG